MSTMEKKSKELMLKWVNTWKKAGRELAKIRIDEIRQISTQEALQNLSGAFESARLNSPLRASSGLVEQQAYFKKLHK